MKFARVFAFCIFAFLVSFSLVSADQNLTVEEKMYSHLSVSDSGLFFYAPFDYNSTVKIAHDFSSNNYDGTVMGQTYYNSSCIYGGCVWFDGLNDGKDDYVNFPVLKNSARFGSSFTVSTWVRNKGSVSSSLRNMMGTQSAPALSVPGWVLRLDSVGTKAQFLISNGTKIVTANALTANIGVNQWHNIVAVYNNNSRTVQVYVDGIPGILVSGASVPSNGGVSNTDFRIGMTTAFGKIWNGDVDEVMIFDSALNSTQINNIYLNQTSRFYSSGERIFSNLNVSQSGNRVNVSINSSFVFPGVNYSVRVGSDNGNGYDYGSQYDVVNGRADNIPVSTPKNVSVVVIFGSTTNGFYSPLMTGNVSVVISDQAPLPPRNYTYERQRVAELINGANHTVRVLYMGNSRVAKSVGFAFDGIEEIAYENGRLAGEGYVVPMFSAGGSDPDLTGGDDRFLYNHYYGVTSASNTWKALDTVSQQHDHFFEGLALNASRSFRMSTFGEGMPLLTKDVPLNLTIDYLAGPGKGVFRVTPIELWNNSTVKYSHPFTDINTSDTYYHVAHVTVSLPPMNNVSLARTFTLNGVSGDTTIYRTGVGRDVANGIYISEMAIGGEGFQSQANESELPGVSWTDYVAAENPDIILWQYASNDGFPGVIDATKVLMDRAKVAAPNAINLVLIETPAPRDDIDKLINYSVMWADGVDGYNGAIILNSTAFLPQDFLDLKGTCKTVCQLGKYFAGPIHENRVGARAVGNAVWAAMANFSNFTEPDNSLITSCQNLSVENTVYKLNNDVSSNGTCFNINANNITLNGRGHSITYSTDGSVGNGIKSDGFNFTNIMNSVIVDGNSNASDSSGIYLLNGNNIQILNNSLNVLGENGNGIFADSVSNSNFTNNVVSTSGIYADAIKLSNSDDNALENNILQAYGDYSLGLRLIDSSNNNLFSNMITTSGLEGTGLNLISAENNNFANNIFSTLNAGSIVIDDSASLGNSFSNISIIQRNENYSDLSLNQPGIDNTTIIDSLLQSYYFADAGSLLSFRNSDLGEIKFLSAVNGSGTSLADDVVIEFNHAAVRSDVNSGLNSSAQITLYGLPTDFVNPEIKRDGESCPVEICTNLTGLNDGTVVFTVTGWSSYSIGEIV